MEHVSEFKYLGCVLDESGTDDAECQKEMASGRKVAGIISFLVSARGLQPECARVLFVLLYGRRKKERFTFRAVQRTTSEVCWIKHQMYG